MTERRRRPDPIPDALSPDFAICEHCKMLIGWDDYSYTHLSNGFASCGTTISGGSKPRGIIGRTVRSLGLTAVVNPTITQDPAFTTVAEPREWFEDVPA